MNAATAQMWVQKLYPTLYKPERTHKGPSEYLLRYEQHVKTALDYERQAAVAEELYAQRLQRQAKLHTQLAYSLRSILLITNEEAGGKK